MKLASEPEKQSDRYTDAVPCWQLYMAVENIGLDICDVLCQLFLNWIRMCVSHVLENNFLLRTPRCKGTATASVWLSVRRLATKTVEYQQTIFFVLFLSFRRVLHVICSFLGNSPASEF